MSRKPIVLIARHRRYIGKYFDDEDYAKSSKREDDVAKELTELSESELDVNMVGYGAGIPKKFTKPKPHGAETPLDLEVKKSERNIAVVEVMGSDAYTFNTSGFFPVAWDKVERAKKSEVPAFFVFVLDLEEKPNKWWIDANRCRKYELARNFRTKYDLQDIYKTNQYHWHRGLKTLVAKLIELAESSKQTTLL